MSLQVRSKKEKTKKKKKQKTKQRENGESSWAIVLRMGFMYLIFSIVLPANDMEHVHNITIT